MRIFKVVSALLSYPQTELVQALGEIADAVSAEADLAEASKAGLLEFIDSRRHLDLIDWQQQYVELFDRGRALSLLIFEHVHGESRDRGQAMVDLLRLYQSHGFALDARELPDHVPLFLEFLSRLPKASALDFLGGALPVLNLLGARLAERDSPYAALFAALADIAGNSDGLDALREQAAAEGPDETLARMDAIWEEEVVSFMGNPKACDAEAVQPLKYTHRPVARV
jgi:nitrate reductase delta subunit